MSEFYLWCADRQIECEDLVKFVNTFRFVRVYDSKRYWLSLRDYLERDDWGEIGPDPGKLFDRMWELLRPGSSPSEDFTVLWLCEYWLVVYAMDFRGPLLEHALGCLSAPPAPPPVVSMEPTESSESFEAVSEVGRLTSRRPASRRGVPNRGRGKDVPNKVRRYYRSIGKTSGDKILGEGAIFT